jgi:Transposase zinc-binding domain
MARPRLEVADVFRAHGAAWRKANAGHVSLAQLKVMSAIETCRTAALGGHVERCEDCAHERVAWVLSGPDKASLRLGVRLGFRDRLVALETLLSDVGFRPKNPLRTNYTRQWHAEAVSQMVILEGPRRP